MDALGWALRYERAGLSVVPVRPDGTKQPAVAWKRFQSERATPDLIREWFPPGSPYGVGVVCGAVSGGLVVIDFEAEAAFRDWLRLLGPLAEEAARCPLARTPDGGRHLYARCASPGRNDKLAMAAGGKVLIETRGEGGYVVAPGSPAACHPSGNVYTWEAQRWISR